MTFLPIVERELRVASRRRSTYWERFCVALGAIVILAWILAATSQNNGIQRTVGPTIFVLLAGLGFVFSLGGGAYATADCLSAEKREGTLGLLFLTDLRGYDVVLGKLAATSLGTIYSLLAIVPMMALPLLLGGVNPIAVGIVALTLLNTLFFSLAAGMFSSAVSRDERKAVSFTGLLILGITGGLPLAGAIIQENMEARWHTTVAWALYLPSPGFAFVQGMNSVGGIVKPAGILALTDFWWSTATVHALAWLFLGLACAILPRTWSERAAADAKPGSGRALWRQVCYGDAVQRKALRDRLLAINPLTWLGGRNRFSRAAPWLFLAAVALGWLFGYWKVRGARGEWCSAPVAIGFALILHSYLKYQLSGEACRRFAEDRHNGALELLLSTPLTVPEVLRGQLQALRRQFLGPIIAVLAADVFLLVGALHETGNSRSDTAYLIVTFAAGMLALVADAFTLSWLGMWLGLRARSFSRAWGDTMFWVLVLPWAVFVFSVVSVAMLGTLNGPTSPPGFFVVIGWWLFLALANDFILFGWAQVKLHGDFRTEAARRFQPGAKGWRWWPFGQG